MFHATTILSVRDDNKVVMAGDGQVSVGDTVFKSNAKKVRRLYKDSVLAGFDGYGKNDQRTKVIDEIFDIYKKSKKSLEINFLTPSSYYLAKKYTYEI